MYFLYILECTDGTLYTGITTDIKRRLGEHKAGKGASYTRSRGAKRIVYSEKAKSRGEALKREAEIKRWTRHKKLQLVKVGMRKMDMLLKRT